MELLQNFAPDVWLAYNRELETFKGNLDKELESLRKEAELVRVWGRIWGGRKEVSEAYSHDIFPCVLFQPDKFK